MKQKKQRKHQRKSENVINEYRRQQTTHDDGDRREQEVEDETPSVFSRP